MLEDTGQRAKSGCAPLPSGLGETPESPWQYGFYFYNGKAPPRGVERSFWGTFIYMKIQAKRHFPLFECTFLDFGCALPVVAYVRDSRFVSFRVPLPTHSSISPIVTFRPYTHGGGGGGGGGGVETAANLTSW